MTQDLLARVTLTLILRDSDRKPRSARLLDLTKIAVDHHLNTITFIKSPDQAEDDGLLLPALVAVHCPHLHTAQLVGLPQQTPVQYSTVYSKVYTITCTPSPAHLIRATWAQ